MPPEPAPDEPANLMMDEDNNVFVTDFGLAKMIDSEDLTDTGDVLGTLRYMPPEAFDGRADHRSDMYAEANSQEASVNLLTAMLSDARGWTTSSQRGQRVEGIQSLSQGNQHHPRPTDDEWLGFEGNVEIADATKTFIELGGTGDGEFDQLQIDGNLEINNGGLIVSLIDGFELRLGDRFLIADVESALEGQFFGLGEGELVETFDGTDLFITYRGFGANRGVGLFTVAIPEPSSCVLIAAFCFGVLRRNRRAIC